MSKWKGIVLAGGSGSRLHPITLGISKQLLPVYDKPMIYYPLSVLMLAEIKDIMVITTPTDLSSFKNLLGDGSTFGVNITYAEQATPAGIAEAFIIAEEFIGDDNVVLILGDNIFYGQSFKDKLNKAKKRKIGATLFGYNVRDPHRFGVVEFDEVQRVVSIEEKPDNPKSNTAVTGLYFYDNSVVSLSRSLKPSTRGELEITDLNQLYLDQNKLHVELFGRGFAWLDTGTHDSLIEAGQFIQTIEHRQGFKVACLEEIGCRNGWITPDQVAVIGNRLGKTGYGQYLVDIAGDC